MIDLLETLIENREMVQPNHANNLGVTHGGTVMKWMDEIGAMSAMRFSGETCVTARVNKMDFERPIPVGETAFITAYVYDAGETSVNVRITTERETLQTREKVQTTESYFVYVAIDGENRPTAVPDLTTSSDRGEELRRVALDGERDSEAT